MTDSLNHIYPETHCCAKIISSYLNLGAFDVNNICCPISCVGRHCYLKTSILAPSQKNHKSVKVKILGYVYGLRKNSLCDQNVLYNADVKRQSNVIDQHLNFQHSF